MNELIKKIMDETTDTEKVELFKELTRYIVANTDKGKDHKEFIDFFDAIHYVYGNIGKFNIGTHPRDSWWTD